MGYKVAIRKNETGEIRLYEWTTSDWDESGTSDDFFWTDGNFSCDCNRRLSFMRAGGEEISVEDHGHCGSTAFSALYAELPDGRRIPLDDE